MALNNQKMGPYGPNMAMSAPTLFLPLSEPDAPNISEAQPDLA